MEYRFPLIEKLPPYVFAVINHLKMEARHRGEDVIDLGMGNPDLPTPDPIVDKLIEAARNPRNHRYSASRGIPNLRVEISRWYARRYNVEIDPETEAIATIGAKEGFSHLVLALVEPGDKVIVPDPSYPIHSFAATIASCELIKLPIAPDSEGGSEVILDALRRLDYPRSEQPKLLVLSFPHNPTTVCVDKEFFEEVVAIARERGYLIVHDLAYADLVFDGYKAPSILEVKGAKDVAVEMFSMSKSYSMAGWRMGFCVGNRQAVAALTRIKSYLDYGMFQPIQIAGIIALRDCDQVVPEIVEVYRKRRDCLIKGLNSAGWNVPSPKGTMFVWAKLPEHFAKLGSLEFAKLLLKNAGVAVSPGIGFGDLGDGYVRFALVENEQRISQAVRGIKTFLSQEPDWLQVAGGGGS
jgi:alanine-synthesizing transaminase